MNEKELFDRGLAGEPPLGLDFAEVQRLGERRVRRRRSIMVTAAAGVAVLIVLGAALVPRFTATRTASYPSIPGCDVVLGPTNTRQGAEPEQGPEGMSAEVSSAVTSEALSPELGAPSTADGFPTTDMATASTTGGAAASTSSVTASPDSAPAAVSGSQAPDPVTTALWDRLASWSISIDRSSMVGALVFGGGRSETPPTISAGASGRVRSATGDGDLNVFISTDNSGPPACHVGELDRRVTYPDGTVVDLIAGTYSAGTNLGSEVVQSHSVHAVAYRPDGTVVIAGSSDVVQLGDDDPATAGIRSSGTPPLTLDQVQELVRMTAFSVTNPDVLALPQDSATTVPDVLGLSQGDAETVLFAAGFTVASSTDINGGSVIAQSPAGGENAPRGGAIELTYVASGTATALPGAPGTARSEAAKALCLDQGASLVAGSGWGSNARLSTWFPTTTTAYQEWQAAGSPAVDGLADPPPDTDLAALCYFEGDFSVPTPGPASATATAAQDVLGIVVLPGSGAALSVVGSRSGIDIDRGHPGIG